MPHSRCRFLISLTYFLSFIIIGSGNLIANGKQEGSNNGWNSIDVQAAKVREIMRRAKAAEIRNYISHKVDPCENFYEFACGNWPKINPANEDQKTGLPFLLLKAYNRRVERLLAAPKLTNESDMERKVKYFYESCLDGERIKRDHRKNLLTILEEFGEMPALKGSRWQEDQFDWLEVAAKILRRYGKSILINLNIAADLTNNDVNRLYVGQLDWLVDSRFSEFYARMKVKHQLGLRQVLGLSVERAGNIASEIVEFEQKLAVGIASPQDKMEDRVRLRLLTEMSESYKPMLNITRLVSLWLGYEYKLPVYEYVESYLQNLQSVLKNTPKRIIANYMLWELLQDFRLDVEETSEKQSLQCVEATKSFFVAYLNKMVYEEMLKNHPHIVSDMDEVWTALKRAFETQLRSNATDWMDIRTRDKALEKLSAMSLEFQSEREEVFNAEFGDLVVSSEDYFENVINILEMRGRNYRLLLYAPPKMGLDEIASSFSPIYAFAYNKVVMPVIFLQPGYLWQNMYPVALKFATLGYVMAHELTHGFDDQYRKYDAKGNLNNWWDRNSTVEFIKRLDCLRQQYDSFTYNGKALSMEVQSENVADNVGIRIAYAAYQSWLVQHQKQHEQQQHQEQQAQPGKATTNGTILMEQESLPQLAYTPGQLFFIGTAQLWCSDVNRHLRHILSDMDVHAPEEIRVKGMFANMEEFAAEFQCRPDSKMNPRRKCLIY